MDENFLSELSTSMFTASGVIYVFYCCDEFLVCVSLSLTVHCRRRCIVWTFNTSHAAGLGTPQGLECNKGTENLKPLRSGY